MGAPGDDQNGDNAGAVHVYEKVSGQWIFQATLLAPDGQSGWQFGAHVAISGDRIAVGSPLNNTAGTQAGSVYTYEQVAGSWIHEQTLVPSSLQGGDTFGNDIDLLGNTLIVSATGDDDKGADAGAAYVYTHGTEWAQSTKITAADGQAGDLFGAAVALGTDKIAVSASGDDDNGSGSGSVYIYETISGGLTLGTKVTASDGSANDYFGHAIAIQGNYLAVGAPFVDDIGFNSGATYLFKRNTMGAWHQIQKFTPSDTTANQQFGWDLDYEGSKLVVSAHMDRRMLANGVGSVYLFDNSMSATMVEKSKHQPSSVGAWDRFGNAVALDSNQFVASSSVTNAPDRESGNTYLFENVGSSWANTQELNPAHTDSSQDNYGMTVALQDDLLAVGVPLDDNDEGGENAGSVYLYRNSGSAWIQEERITASDAAKNAEFGTAIGIDGDLLAVGAPGSNNKKGKVYLFERTTGAWSETDQLVGFDQAAGDRLGSSIAFDGTNLFAGAPGNSDVHSDSGSVYLFTEIAGFWQYAAEILPADSSAAQSFGASIDMDGTNLVVGAPGDGSLEQGAAYVYTKTTSIGPWTEDSKHVPSGANSGDHFGAAVAISDDWFVASSPDYDGTTFADSGKVYIYKNTAGWSIHRATDPSSPVQNGQYGASLALSGTLLAVGAPGYGSSKQGRAELFDLESILLGSSLPLFPTDGADGDAFGQTVAVSQTHTAVGAPGHDDPDQNSGASYLFNTTCP